MEEMNQNELAVFAYACQLLLNNKLYEDLNKLLEFAKNNGSDDYRLFYLGQELKSIEQDKLSFSELSHA